MKKFKNILYVMAFAFILLCMPSTTTQASSLLRQTNPAATSITVNWDRVTTSSSYTVTNYYAQIATDYSAMSTAPKIALGNTATSYTFTGLRPGVEYYVKITYDEKYKSTGNIYNYTVASDYLCTTPDRITGLNQERWYYFIQSVNVVWNKQSGADGYEYVLRNSSGATISSGTKNYNDLSFNVSNNHLYTITVKAYKTINGVKYYGQAASAYLFTQPMCNKATKVVKNKMTIKWNKIKGVSSYSIYVSTKEKTGYKRVKTVSSKKNSITIKKLGKSKIKKNKTYYVYVVANKKIGASTCTSGRLYTYKVKGKSGTLRWTF